MTNDAKLGMLVGVLGVIVAAALFANSQPPQAPQPQPGAPEPARPAVATAAPEARKESPPLASTPVVRTRKDIDAQPASRPTGTDEEP